MSNEQVDGSGGKPFPGHRQLHAAGQSGNRPIHWGLGELDRESSIRGRTFDIGGDELGLVVLIQGLLDPSLIYRCVGHQQFSVDPSPIFRRLHDLGRSRSADLRTNVLSDPGSIEVFESIALENTVLVQILELVDPEDVLGLHESVSVVPQNRGQGCFPGDLHELDGDAFLQSGRGDDVEVPLVYQGVHDLAQRDVAEVEGDDLVHRPGLLFSARGVKILCEHQRDQEGQTGDQRNHELPLTRGDEAVPGS